MATALLVVATTTAVAVGYGGRHFVHGSAQVTFSTSSSSELYNRLLNTGVRGRTLVLFDREVAVSERDYRFRGMMPASAGLPLEPVDITNETAWFMRSGIARRVFVVLPRDRFDERAPLLSDAWNVFVVKGGFERRMEGTPVIYTNGDEVGTLGLGGEKAVVVVNSSEAASYDPALLAYWTAPDRADVVATMEGR